MAAVFALLIVPLVAGVGFFAGLTHAEHSASSAAAMAMFAFLATFVVVGALRLIKAEEDESDRAHARGQS